MKNFYLYYEGVIDPEICNRLLDRAKKENYESGLVNTDKSDFNLGVLNKSVRNSWKQWAPPMSLVECILFRFAVRANYEAEWNFNLTEPEPVQISKYEVGQYYKQHVDIFFGEGLSTNRKISTILLLNDPSEYDGGEVEILTDCVPTKTKGSVIVFPSTMAHQVKEVTRGERYSAVCWVHGSRLI